jgi:DNA-directed RNA polymerase beta subunit
MISKNGKKELLCEVLSSTQERKSKTYVTCKRQHYYLRHNQLTEDIPVGIVFKAMGFESDYDIVSSVGTEPRFTAAMAPSIEDCESRRVITQRHAAEYIAKKVYLVGFMLIECNLDSNFSKVWTADGSKRSRSARFSCQFDDCACTRRGW